MNDDMMPPSDPLTARLPAKGGPAEPKRGSGWTPERRAAQSAGIRATKPWLQSTGPRTAAGKKRASQNGLKHGRERTVNRDIRQALKEQRKSLLAHDAFMRLAMPVLFQLGPNYINNLGKSTD